MSVLVAPIDYYSILDVSRDCSDSTLKLAYRKCALKFHPDKINNNDETAAASSPSASSASQFALISEAYYVLSHANLRALFDQYGESGLKSGVSNGRGGRTPPFVFRSNPNHMFYQHFGTQSPFIHFFNEGNYESNTTQSVEPTSSSSSSSSSASLIPLFSSQGRNLQAVKIPCQEINLYCSLEEIFTGCTKKIKVIRKVTNK